MEHLIEQLESAESLLSDLRSQETNIRTQAEADGVIDATEKAELDRIDDKISQASEVIAKKRAEVEENRRIWQSMAGDFETFRQQTSGMSSWGHNGAETCEQLISEISGAADAQHWKDAADRMRQAQKTIQPLYADYVSQVSKVDEGATKRRERRIDVGNRLAELQKRVAELAG